MMEWMPVVFMLSWGDLYINFNHFPTVEQCKAFAIKNEQAILLDATRTYQGIPPAHLVCMTKQALLNLGLKKNEFSETLI